MKVKTLIKKLEELGDKYKDAEVTIQHPIYPKSSLPIKYKIGTEYSVNRATNKCELIVRLRMDF